MMFWLSRPDHVRWLAAVLLVMVALVVDLAGRRTEAYPFAGHDVMAGMTVTAESVEWRRVPAGLLPAAPALPAAAAVDLHRGDPVTPGTVTTAGEIPAGWWSVPVDLPQGVGAGVAVRLVAVDPPVDADGIVARPGETGAFSMTTPGLVAVPAEAAGGVAVAAATGSLLVLVGT